MLSTLAAIGFDPEIRGILVVATGAIVLMGSVWLLLATNSGVRLGTLIALAGFFGWMVIMGSFWWMRGIGYVGESVSWEVLDFNRGNIAASSVERARDLPDAASLQGLGYALALEYSDEVPELAEFAEDLDRDDPDNAELTDEEFAAAQARNQLRNESTTLSQLASVAPDFVETTPEIPDLNGWRIMNTAEAGEAQATVSAAILETDAFDFESQAEFRFLDAFTVGGKPELPRDPNRWDRISLWITNSLRIKNPTKYAVVQLQAVDEEALIIEEGQAPRFPVVDPDAPIISVVLVRDLGNLRFPPAMITIGSLLIFLGLAYMLHVRDLEVMERVKEFEEAG